jgi:ComF family protein
VLAKIKNAFLEIIFPIRCVGCGTEGEWFCEKCAAKIVLNAKQFCPICWSENAGGKTCERCSSPLDGLRVAASYRANPELARAIATLKYKFSEPLAENLSAILANSIATKNYSTERVVSFVPLHKKRRRWRGFNQAELIAKFVAPKLHLPLANSLIRIKNTSQQAKLNRGERIENLKNAFELAPDFDAKNKTILLVDDVASTATTIIECAKVLKNSGAKEVWGLVLARG